MLGLNLFTRGTDHVAVTKAKQIFLIMIMYLFTAVCMRRTIQTKSYKYSSGAECGRRMLRIVESAGDTLLTSRIW